MSLADYFAVIGACGGLAMIFGLLVLRLTLTHRLKKRLKPTGDYWETGTLDFGIMNTALFAWACTLPYMRRSLLYRSLYPDLDILKFANWFEKTVAYGIIGGLAVMFASAPFFYFFDS